MNKVIIGTAIFLGLILAIIVYDQHSLPTRRKAEALKILAAMSKNCSDQSSGTFGESSTTITHFCGQHFEHCRKLSYFRDLLGDYSFPKCRYNSDDSIVLKIEEEVDRLKEKLNKQNE